MAIRGARAGASAGGGPREPAPKWRAQNQAPAKAGEDAGAAKELIVDSEIEDLTDMVRRLVTYLSNFRALATAVKQRENGKELADIVLTAKPRMLKSAGPKYKFTLDQLAADLAAPATEARAADRPVAAEPSQKFLLALRDLLQSAELTVADLVASRLLPATVSDELLRIAIDDLAAAQAGADSRLAAGQAGRLAFTNAIRAHGQRLADALIMLVQVRHDARSQEPLAAVLAKIGRHFRTGEGRLQPRNWESPLANLPLNPTTGSVNRYRTRFEAFRKAPRRPWRPASLAKRQAASWKAWFDYFENQYLGDRRAQPPFDYADFVLAARGLPPGNLLRADPAEMDVIDWSKAVATALQLEPAVSDWLLFAGLRNLDFDVETMGRLLEVTPVRESERREAIETFVRSGRSRPPSVLYVYPDDSPPARPFAVPGSRPILAVSYSELQSAIDGLDWLATNALFEGGIDGTGE